MKNSIMIEFPYIVLDFKRNEYDLKLSRISGARAETESPLKGSHGSLQRFCHHAFL